MQLNVFHPNGLNYIVWLLFISCSFYFPCIFHILFIQLFSNDGIVWKRLDIYMILLLIDFNGRAKNSDSTQVCWLIGVSHYFKWTFQISIGMSAKIDCIFFSDWKGVDTQIYFLNLYRLN